VRPQLEIDGAPGERWGLAILNGEVVAVELVPGEERDLNGVRTPTLEWRRMRSIPAKLVDYLGVFTAQHFAVLSRRGIPTAPPPAAPVAEAST
jgi:hypothetical protein